MNSTARIYRSRRFHPLWLGLFLPMSVPVWGDEGGVTFNTDVMDVNDRQNIDLSQFSRANYIMPGNYGLKVQLNQQELSEMTVPFYPSEDDAKDSVACLTPEMVAQFGLTREVAKKLTWWHNSECLQLASLKGMETRGDLSTSSLYVSIPQAYLEYTAPNWDPPSRWDDGIPGLLFDYNMNGQSTHMASGGTLNTLTGNGTAGANLGPWRFRADWQSSTGNEQSTRFDWNRYYAYRAIRSLKADLRLGEDYLNSSIFDSFRYTGASLMTNKSMLPPTMRDYTPEVIGTANTNAKVTISQQGRVLYETQVAPGPFRIQNLSDAVSGQLDVKVEEQDGSVQQFTVNTASIPFLTRPGQVRYQLAAGRPSDTAHNIHGDAFALGEFSWGVSNGWSLYGGGIGSEDYQALAIGIGRDLWALGALSFDVTQSHATLPQQDALSGRSFRVNYSKTFDETNSNITFAGYRFSEKNFMSMSDYLEARNSSTPVGNDKERYSLTFNQQFPGLGMSAYLSFNRNTYWDQPNENRYSLTLSRYFDIGRFRNISVSLSANRNRGGYLRDGNDDSLYLSVSMPWGDKGTLSYNMNVGDYHSNTVGYSRRVDDNNSYQLQVGESSNGTTANGYYSHAGNRADMTLSASYQDSQYSSLGMSLMGGMTVTREGGALHRINQTGGTRLMVDTDGTGGVPVRGNSGLIYTNAFGKAIIPDVNDYFRNQASIDLNMLGDNVDATRSTTQATLTKGAIGYRHFEVVSGEKMMSVIRLADGTVPPFGATVQNTKSQETGLINDDGNVWLTGIKANEKMFVRWEGKTQCTITLPPAPLPAQTSTLLLPCIKDASSEWNKQKES